MERNKINNCKNMGILIRKCHHTFDLVNDFFFLLCVNSVLIVILTRAINDHYIKLT